VGLKSGPGGRVSIEQRMAAPAEKVSDYISDFRNAREWMVGVESVERLGEDTYRLVLESPIGKIRPEVSIIEQGPESISWVYTSTIDGGGRMEVSPDNGGGCLVSYTGEFHLKRKLFDRAARLIGAEKFARTNGERSISRLKYLMEASRY
jgi:carbon monoxide dehydrogenase subunit G